MNLYVLFGVPAAVVFAIAFVFWAVVSAGEQEWHWPSFATAMVALVVWVPLMVLDVNRHHEPPPTCAENEILIHGGEAVVYGPDPKILTVPTDTCMKWVTRWGT